MSVEKFRPIFEEGSITHEPKPYTTILNFPIQQCTNLEAIGLWVYLQSKSENWKLVPKQLQNHFGIGENKVYALLNFLIEVKLLERTRRTWPNGMVKDVIYVVKSGENFQYNQHGHPLDDLPDVDNPDVVNHHNIQNKRSHTKEKKITKHKRPSGDGHVRFNEFWNCYKRKEKKKRTLGIWIKNGLDKIADEIIAAVNSRNNTQWKNIENQYIPCPDEYLHNERWEDEVDGNKSTHNQQSISVDNQYVPCSNCKRPKLHCQCHIKLASRETSIAAVAEIREKLRIN